MKKKLLIILFLIFAGRLCLDAQSEKFKALFLYNFTKYIEWPSAARQGEFVIGILGNPSLAKEMEVIASKQKVGSQSIVVKIFSSVDEVDNCQMLYISPSKSSQLNSIISKLQTKPVLIVTDKEGLANQGAAINFIMDGDRIKFEINKKNIEKYSLTVTSSLLALGTVVQ